MKTWFDHRSGYPSQRKFASDVGCSIAYLNYITRGERNLNPVRIDKFCERLGLSDRERRYFGLLVDLDRAHGPDQRAEIFERLMDEQRRLKARELVFDQYEFISNWYFAAIYELAGMSSFRGDPDWIAATLVPSITRAQAQAALQRLQEMGLLVEQGGALRPAEVILIAQNEDSKIVHELAWRRLHRWFLGRAQEVIDEMSWPERTCTLGTMAISEELVPEVAHEISEFQKRMLALAARSQASPAKIYQLCIQLFPLSRSIEEEE